MNLDTLCRLRRAGRQAIEQFFYDRSYIDCDVPIMVPMPGTEVHLDYFETNWQDYHEKFHKLFLRSSPELHLKIAMCSGMERIFHLGKVFRNGGELSNWHHPEFTMLEWYESGIGFFDYMQQTEALVRHVCYSLKENGFDVIELPNEFERHSIYDLFRDLLEIELSDGDANLATKLRQRGLHSVIDGDDFETAFFKALLDVIEPYLSEKSAVFVYDYPPSQAALSKVEGGRAKRFELYLNGVELCNAFLELISKEENEVRMKKFSEYRSLIGKQEVPVDQDFLESLSKGMPACCGNAMGFDRLLAVLLGKNNIDDVVPFRSLKIYPSADF